MSLFPSLSFAQNEIGSKLDYSGLVKCDGVLTKDGTEPDRQTVCDFNALLDTVKSGINWLFFMTVPIVTVLFAYGGFLYMTGVKGNMDTAKKIFQSAAKGFIIMLVAWFAVVTVVSWFVKPDSGADTFVNIKK